MPRLLLVRHGESVWNAEERWQGWADPPLSARGERQTLAAAVHLREYGLTAVSSSDLVRARRTAELLAAELNIDLHPADPGLRERDVGQWSGLTRQEIDVRWPGRRDTWLRGELAAPPGGEDNATFTKRVVGAIVRVASGVDGGPMLVVSHGGVIRALERHAGEESVTVTNLGARWFDVDGDRVRAGSVVALNDPDVPNVAPVF